MDEEGKAIEEAISKSSPAKDRKRDWTALWGKKYPVLLGYREKVDVAPYEEGLRKLLDELREEGDYSELDAVLVLKDILAKLYFRGK